MNYILAILAGAIQGLTEFLPISSTGHLIIFEHVFNIPQQDFGLTFDASLHLGTLVAVIIFFWKDYIKALNPKNGLIYKLIIGTIPAAILGLIFESAIESKIRHLWVVGLSLIIFSIVLFIAEKYSKNKKDASDTTIGNVLIIGIFQALALIPGVSRSGSTISAGLFLNLKRDEAAKFAFMLSGPIIAGAGLKKFLEIISTQNIASSNLNFFIIGMISSCIFGYLTIKYFLKYLSSKTLYPFIIYRIVLGAILIIAPLLF